MSCRICQCEDPAEDYTFIDLAVNGSEGLYVCEQCKMVIIEHIRNMEHVASRAKTQAWLTFKNRTPK